MATHSNTLDWKIPWTEEPGRLQSMGSPRVGHDWATSLSLFTFMHWRSKWQPTPVFLPGESQGRGSLVGCSPWGRRVGHDWCELAAAAFIFLKVLFLCRSLLKSLLNMLKYCFCLIFHFFGLCSMWDLSSPTRNRTCTPCIGRQSLNHWGARKAPRILAFKVSFLTPQSLLCFLSRSQQNHWNRAGFTGKSLLLS